MGDSEEEPAPSGIPGWQRDRPNEPDANPPELEVARRFLDDDEVRSAPRDKKVQFLKSKGVAEDDIQTLLGESDKGHEELKPDDNTTPPTSTASSSLTSPPDHPPVVTYPEFLTKPARPPPLVTTTGLVNTLYASAGLATVLYGTSRFVVAPMVDGLTDARAELLAAASARLASFTTLLEGAVSEVPAAQRRLEAAGGGDNDGGSDTDDPAEMFHRDVGTQTSPGGLTPADTISDAASGEPESARQAARLAALTQTLSELGDGFRGQSEGLVDVKALVGEFRDDLDALTYGAGAGGPVDFVSGYDMHGRGAKAEPEDEIRRVRDSIRRVKGVLLSTRSFPASTR